MNDDAAIAPDHLLGRPTGADVDEMLALVHACDIAAIGFPDFTADDIQEWLDAAFTASDLDGWLVRDARGRLVAWAYIESSYGGRNEHGNLYLHPDADDALYRPLADLLVRRSAERAAASGHEHHKLVFWCTNEPRLEETVAALGAHKAKTFARMRRDLDGSEGGLPIPDDVTISTVDPDDDGQMREFHAVYVDAFSSHYAFEPSTYEAWRAQIAAAPSVPYDEWRMARIDDAAVGVMQAADMSVDGGGWIRNLAVLSAYRGRGVARALLDQAFAEFHAKGYTWAGLGVDLQNETGAYRLYESVGMRVHFKADAWELTVPAIQSAEHACVGGSR